MRLLVVQPLDQLMHFDPEMMPSLAIAGGG